LFNYSQPYYEVVSKNYFWTKSEKFGKTLSTYERFFQGVMRDCFQNIFFKDSFSLSLNIHTHTLLSEYGYASVIQLCDGICSESQNETMCQTLNCSFSFLCENNNNNNLVIELQKSSFFMRILKSTTVCGYGVMPYIGANLINGLLHSKHIGISFD
jgi:hypothetical protein